MTRLRAMQAVLAVLTMIMIWSWTREPPPSVLPEKMRRRRATAVEKGAAGVVPVEAGTAVRRDLFEYGEAPTATPMRPATFIQPAATATPVEMTSGTATPIKLVGLVRQAAGLRAALAIDGDVVLVAPGEEIGGYKIVSIDEDSGVVLSAPDGRAVELRREEPR